MKGKARSWWIGFCGTFAVVCLAMGVFVTKPSINVSASGTAPTIVMEAGASARKTVGEPGIKFTAKLENYDSSDQTYSYGMLILPEAAWENLGWDNDTDYFAYFDEKGIDFGADGDVADIACTPYQMGGEWYISGSLTNIKPYNYDMSFVGVGYAYNADDDYIYADVDLVENGRSIAYVAQMALKYEENLTSEQEAALEKFVNASNIQIDKEDYWKDPSAIVGGTTSATADNYAAKRTFNVSEEISFITKEAYAGGSEVSFKYYIPEGTTTGWWGIAWHTDATKANNYHAAGVENAIGYKALGKELGAWTDVSFTLPAGGPYYLYFGSEVGKDKGNWMVDGNNSYALIDDFKVGATTESFTDNINDSIFQPNASVISSYLYEKAEVSFGEAGTLGEYSAKIVVDKLSRDAKTPSFITSSKYAGGVTVTFDYYMSGNTNNKWWTLNWTTNNTSANIYAFVEPTDTNNGVSLPVQQDVWQTVSVEIPAGEWYFYFAGAVGEWSNGYVLIDNFAVDGEVVEDFNNGVEDSIFNVNTAGAIVDGDGYVYKEKELAMKFIPNAGEAVSAITKEAYAAGSTVSFKYYIPAGTQVGWWGIAWHTDATKANNYHAAGIENAIGYKALGKELGAWTDVSFTLPVSGGPYYLYFGANTGNEWKVNGENSYILIDDFTVNGETDTFNGGYENSLFTVKDANRTTLSADGEGYTGEAATPEELGEIAMKFLLNNGDEVRARTTIAYAGGSTVSFRYFIQADTAVQWTRFIWDTDTSCDNYADTYTSFGNTAGEWVKWSYTLPAGGPYYLYFGFESGNWKDSSGAPYILFDDFTVNGEVETFNYGVENSIFTILKSNLACNSEDGEGFTALNGEFGAKLNINAISSDAKTPSFITSSKYAGGVTVTFDYYMSGNTNNKWWTLNWTTSNTSANIYAFVEPTDTNNGVSLPVQQDVWQTVSVEIPAGEWYFYFGGAVGEWGDGYVIIDNFKIGNHVTETFNNGEYGIFLNNKADAITIADGKAAEVVPDEPVEENPDPYALVNLLKDASKLTNVLENGGYAWLAANGTIDATNMPASRLLLEGSISFAITGEKEFAIYFGNNAFIFVNGSIVAVYNGTDKIGTIEYSAENGEATLFFAVTAGGKLNLSVGESAYAGFGWVTPTMMQIVGLGGSGKVLFNAIDVETYKCVYFLADNVPVYASTEGIDFTAYAFDSDNMVSEEGFRLLSEAGFTKTLALLQGRLTSGDLHEQDIPNRAHVEKLMAEVNADAMAALELAEKYGMKHYVLNSNLYNIERNPNNYQWLDDFAELATYTLSQALAGHFLADEPSHTSPTFTQTELEELVNAYKAYKAAFPDGEAFINLYPNTSTLLSGDSTYNTYIDYYIKNIALDKDGVKGTGYVSFDHYPLKNSEVTSKHLRNLELVAEKCRDNGLELRTYIKSSESGDSQRSLRATQSINDLYMQIYSALAYGSKEIIYYQFTDHTIEDGTAGDAVMNGTSLAVNDVYNWAKRANNEVRMFGTAYMNFTWQSASVFGKTDITQFKNLKSKASVYGYISSVDSDASVLVGNFARKTTTAEQYGDNYAYMVVNYGNTDGATSARTAVNITFNGTPTRALVYQQGKPTVVALSSNVLTLNLQIGEGAFVIPLTNS